MKIGDREICAGDILLYDVRIMAGYGWGYTAPAVVLTVGENKVRIEYRKRSGEMARRWVEPRFLYLAPD